MLTEEGGRAAAKEEINKMREKMMDVAIAKLQQKIRTNPHAVQMELLEIQRSEFLKRDMAETKRTDKMDQANLFDLLCSKCSTLICHASDVRVILNAHHAVIDPRILQRVSAKRVKKAKYVDQQIQCAVGKIYCEECGLDLGNITIYMKANFPVIKIENFIIFQARDKTRITVKAWKQAPFVAQPLTAEDQRRWIESDASNNLLLGFGMP